MPVPRVVLHSFLLLAVACGGSAGDAAAPAVVVDTLADTVRVRALRATLWPDTADLVAEVAIGEAEGPDELLIGSVRSLAEAPDGSILFLDAQVPALRHFDAAGRYLRTIGRAGAGPGEYRRPDGGLVVLADGRIVLRDPGNARMTQYAPDGTFLAQWPISGSFNTGRRMVRTAGDTIASMVLMTPGVPVDQWRLGLARATADGTIVDTVPVPRWDYAPPSISASREGNSSVSPVPFAPSAPWDFSPLGYVVGGIGDTYRLTLFRPDGPLRIEREWTPVPVLAAERDEQEARETWQMRQGYPGWTWNGPPIPDTKPAFLEITAGSDGRLWVRVPTRAVETEPDEPAGPADRRPPPLRHREPPAFDVFAPDGTFLGHVRAPLGLQRHPAPIFNGDHAWAVMIDPESGIPRVTRFRVVGREGGRAEGRKVCGGQRDRNSPPHTFRLSALPSFRPSVLPPFRPAYRPIRSQTSLTPSAGAQRAR